MKESAGRILMLLENSFPEDTRVRNEAFTLFRAGYKVTIIALRSKGEKFTETVNGVTVYRIPRITVFRKVSPTLGPASKKLLNVLTSVFGYAVEYFYFTAGCFILSCYIAVRHGFDVVHAHNPPDTLFAIGAFYKMLGKKFVFDHHDLSPELYLSRFGTQDGVIFKSLLLLERLSLSFSDIVIATNQSYKQIQVQRGRVDPDQVFVVRNGPDLKRLKSGSPNERLLKMKKRILVYLGEMNPQDGVDHLLGALKLLICDLGRTDFYCVLIGRGDSLEDLQKLAVELNLDQHVHFTGFVPDEELVCYLSTADICLDPNPSSPLNDHSTWIKVMEYMALGKPIVSFRLKETVVTAQEAALYVTPNNEYEFAEAIVELMDQAELRKQMGSYGKERIRKHLNWEIVSRSLLSAYKALQGT